MVANNKEYFDKEFFNKLRRFALMIESEREFARFLENAKPKHSARVILTKEEAASSNNQYYVNQDAQKDVDPIIIKISSIVAAAILDPQLQNAYVQALDLTQSFVQSGKITANQANQVMQAVGKSLADPAPIHQEAERVAQAHRGGNFESHIQQQSIHNELKTVIREYLSSLLQIKVPVQATAEVKPAAQSEVRDISADRMTSNHTIGLMLIFGREFYVLNNAFVSQGQTELLRALMGGPFQRLGAELATTYTFKLSENPFQLNNEANNSHNALKLSLKPSYRQARKKDDDEEVLQKHSFRNRF